MPIVSGSKWGKNGPYEYYFCTEIYSLITAMAMLNNSKQALIYFTLTVTKVKCVPHVQDPMYRFQDLSDAEAWDT